MACQAFLSTGFFQAKILEWVAISFSRGSSWPTDGTYVSCIAGGFFISWVTREVLIVYKIYNYMLWKLRYSSIMIPTVFSLVFLKLLCWLKGSFMFLSFIKYYGKNPNLNFLAIPIHTTTAFQNSHILCNSSLDKTIWALDLKFHHINRHLLCIVLTTFDWGKQISLFFVGIFLASF